MLAEWEYKNKGIIILISIFIIEYINFILAKS